MLDFDGHQCSQQRRNILFTTAETYSFWCFFFIYSYIYNILNVQLKRRICESNWWENATENGKAMKHRHNSHTQKTKMQSLSNIPINIHKEKWTNFYPLNGQFDIENQTSESNLSRIVAICVKWTYFIGSKSQVNHWFFLLWANVAFALKTMKRVERL